MSSALEPLGPLFTDLINAACCRLHADPTGKPFSECYAWLRVMPSRNIFLPSEFRLQNTPLPAGLYKEKASMSSEGSCPHQNLGKSQEVAGAAKYFISLFLSFFFKGIRVNAYM